MARKPERSGFFSKGTRLSIASLCCTRNAFETPSFIVGENERPTDTIGLSIGAAEDIYQRRRSVEVAWSE